MESGMVAMKISSEQHQQQAQQLCFKALSFNGKRETRHELQHYVHETLSSYMECQKNHAASTGGYALDGCGEYMPPLSPSLNCAACGCHRNFHRLETPSATAGLETRTIAAAPLFIHRSQRLSSTSPSNSSSPSRSDAPISSIYPSAPQILMALSSGVDIPNQTAATTMPTTTTPGAQMTLCLEESGKSRKRFRTKFSPEQKEKMRRFAEGYGWKMQRSDNEVVRKFCDEIGVCKSVLKVWMHNNKSRNTMGSINFEYNLSGGLRIGSEEEEKLFTGNHVRKQSTDGGSTSSV